MSCLKKVIIFDVSISVWEKKKSIGQVICMTEAEKRMKRCCFTGHRPGKLRQDEHTVKQAVPILREYVKDGILDVTENLIPLEHTAAEIHAAVSGDEQIEMLSENIMIYVKEFGNLNKSNVLIDNAYIGMFIEELRREFNF